MPLDTTSIIEKKGGNMEKLAIHFIILAYLLGITTGLLAGGIILLQRGN